MMEEEKQRKIEQQQGAQKWGNKPREDGPIARLGKFGRGQDVSFNAFRFTSHRLHPSFASAMSPNPPTKFSAEAVNRIADARR